MNGMSFRGRGCIIRGRKTRGIVTGNGGTQIPQPNFIQSNRESHVPPRDFWMEHAPPPPWQQINGPPLPQRPLYSNFESHQYRGRPQFCPSLNIRGNCRKIRGESRPKPGILPTPGFWGLEGGRPPQSEPLRFAPPLGSEEERQQKIAETADKIKQKLSDIEVAKTVTCSKDDVKDVNFSQTEEQCIPNKAIPELKYDPPELDLTVNDFKDIGRVDLDITASLCNSVRMSIQKNKKPEVKVETVENPKSNAWDDTRLKNIKANVNEPMKITEKLPVSCRLAQSIECAQETVSRSRDGPEESSNEPTNDELDQMALKGANDSAVYDRKSSTSKLSSELSSSQVEKDNTESKKIAVNISGSQPEFNKVREKLREVIKVERQHEKEGTSIPPPDNRTTLFQHATGPRVQPPVRLDFHPGIRPRVPRFQGSPNFHPPFHPEHGIEMRPTFRPDFPPRFNHGPKNFNISPRLQGPQMAAPEFNARALPIVGPRQMLDHVELNMQLNFDPREPPPRFNAPVFNPNELPPKFCPPSGLNGFQPPPGFYQNGPPPRFVNQDQKSGGLPPSFAPNLNTSSPVADFPQLVPPSYNQIPPMHCSSFAPPINGSFNPAMPPPNPASCIISKFPPPSMPSSASSSSCSSPFTTDVQPMMQLPSIPMNALEIQPPPPPPPHPPPVPPPPPPSRHLNNASKTTNEQNFSQENDGATPNMKDELEEMQEALKFAQQSLNMSYVETEGDATKFNMLMFPDLPPIPSNQPSDIEEEPMTRELGNDNANKRAEVCKLRDNKQIGKPRPRIVSVKMITQEEFLMEEEEDEQLSLDDQIRAKVVFNVNPRSKKLSRLNEWQNQNNENSLISKKSSEKVLENSAQAAKEGANKHWKNLSPKEGWDAILSEKWNNQKDSQQQGDEDREQDTRTSQGSSGSLIAVMDSNTSNKDIVNDSIDQSRKFRGSGLKIPNKSLLASTVDANWKDKVINQFLKMSKNDICNMVNSSGLRKFDIAMKHLVKERKYSLSQERRSSVDDAIRGYDMSREEFMSQLSAMLDPSATVDIKNLPSKFIQHLSEVLKLDVESHLADSIDPWPAPTSLVTNNTDVNYNNGSYNDQNNSSENNNQQDSEELLDSDSFSVHIKSEMRPTQAIQMSTDISNFCMARQLNGDQIATLTNVTTIGDIFSAGIAEAKLAHESVTPTVATTSPEQERNTDRINGKFFPYDIIRVRGLTTMQISGENLERNDMLSSRSEDQIPIEKTGDFSEDKSQEEYENIERWNRRKRQDPDMFRNLTKEEWETKYSKSVDSLAEKERVLSRKETSPKSTNSSRSTEFRDQEPSGNSSPPLSSNEINWNAGYALERSDETHRWSKLKDHNPGADSETDKSSNCASRSGDSDGSPPSDVTKLLKVIKSQEKIAKNISVDQRMRDEVSTEIELARQTDRERQRERRIREVDRDTKSRKSRDRRKCSNDSDFVRDETGREVSNRKEIEHEKDEMMNNIDNVRLSKSSSDLAGIDEPDERNFQMQQPERIEFPVQLKNFTNNQEILLTPDYMISPASQALADKTPSIEALPSININLGQEFVNEKESEHPQSPTLTQNNSENLEIKETRNVFNGSGEMQSSKSGTKKIDIQAYKARKLQRNNEKQDNKIGEIETDFNLSDSGTGLPIRSEDATDRSKTEYKQTNISKNHTSTKLKEERNSAPKLSSDKKYERRSRNEINLVKHQNSEKSMEELHREEKFDKKRLRNYSRDSHRSRSREDNRKTSKEKSQRSSRETSRYSKSENKTRSKSPRDKNYSFESKDKKPAKHRIGDTPKEIHERTDKRDKNRKTIAENEPGRKRALRKRYDAKKEGHCSEPGPVRNTSDKISTHRKIVEDSQRENRIINNKTPEDLKIIDSTNLERGNEEMLTDVTEITVNLEVSQASLIDKSRESSLRNIQTVKNDPPSSQIKDNVDFTKSIDAEDSSHFNEKEITGVGSENINPESTFHSTNRREDAKRLSYENKDYSVENKTEDCSATEKAALDSDAAPEEKSTDNSDIADTKVESSIHKITGKIKIFSKFDGDELQLGSEYGESEVKLIVDDKIQKVISQPDSLNEKNEDADNMLSRSYEKITISSPAALKFGGKAPFESTVIDLNSPGTPESPLKGFSEETIQSSILGKRKLAQSVLKIREDYVQNKDSTDLDNTVIIRKNSDELTSYCESEKIDALSAKNRGLENILITTETNLEDVENRCNKSECNEVIADQEIESIKKDRKKNPGTSSTHEEYEICARSVTPSGDTLSLGSSIDFENDEFIVLSEISSDENFSQDEERKREATSVPENKENMNKSKVKTKQENLKKAERRAVLNNVSQKADNILASTNAQSPKSEANRFSHEIPSTASEMMETNVQDLAEPYKVDISSHSSELELKSNQSKNQNTFSAAETSIASVPEECKEQLLQEKDNLNLVIVNDERVSSRCVSIESDDLVIEKVDVGKIFSIETEAHSDKTKKDEETVKHVKSKGTKNFDVLSKTNRGSNESSAKKNVHRVKRSKRGKRKNKLKLNEEKIKEISKDKNMVTVVEKLRTRECAMARIAKIDMEIQKLLYEKMKINQILQCNGLPTEKNPTDGKDDLSTLKSGKEPDSRPSNIENNETSAKLTKLDAKTKSVSFHKKFSTNIISNVLEDDIGNRGNGKEKEKKKKINKHDRSSSKDNSLPETESGSVSLHRTLPKKSTHMKNSVMKKEKSKKDCNGRSSRQQEEGSLSSNLQHKKHTSRIDKEVTLAKSTDQTTPNKSVSEPCQKNTKIDNHGRSQKKVNKIADSKDDTIRHSKKEGQHCEANDEIRSASRTGCELLNDPTEKQMPEIHLDESNQESGCFEQEGGKKTSKGLALLEESYKQEKAGLRKRQRAVFCKRRKGSSKTSSESNSRALSPAEEEMPLQLLYIKKCNQQSEPLKNAESSAKNDKPQIPNTKPKGTRSAELLEHAVKVINDVAKNKKGNYRKSNKLRVKSEEMVDTDTDKVERKEKILKKLKRDPTHVSNRSTICEAKDVWSVTDLPNSESRSSYGKSLDGNDYRNNLTESDDLNSDERGVGSSGRKSSASVHDADNKSLPDKIVETSKKCRDKAAYSSSKTKATSVKEDVDQVSQFEDFYEEDMNEMFRGESGKYILSEQWDIAEDETFDYGDDIPQFLNSNSNLIPQDSISHSNSTSCNFNMGKEPDIFDLMLETVASDFEKTSKNFLTSGLRKRKRKKMISGDRESENDLNVEKRVRMSLSEMMDCSVRLVDCKYTHSKNYQNARARRKSNTSAIVHTLDKSTESSTYSQKCNGSFSSEMKTTTDSYAHTTKSKSHFSPELTSSDEPNAAMECPDWSFGQPQLTKDDKVVSPSSTEFLTSRSHLGLDITDRYSKSFDNDLKMIEPQTSSGSKSLKKAESFPEKLTKAGNSRYFDEMQSTGLIVAAKPPFDFSLVSQLQQCDEQVTIISDIQDKNEVNTSGARKQLTECGVCAKPLSKLVDPEVHNREASARGVENIKERVEASEKNAIKEEKAEQDTSEKRSNDIPILDQIENKEDNEIQEIELPRIQYSVHKGPILDLKVFGDSILAASEDGVIYRYSQTCNGILNTYEGHKSAVTCMYVLEVDSSGSMKDWLFSGSLDGSLRCFDIKTSMQVRTATDVGSSIQCMDQSWGVIFLGTKSGYVSRFHIKANVFKDDEIQFSEEAVLGLKATTEGPRRVLIVASRNQPITIRDAQNGLLIRTISGHKSHTVYSLLMDSNLVYCGTSGTAIPVFDFINGSEIKLYTAGPGIVCMRMSKQLLFAGCYDGNIYVFDTKEQKIVCSIPGPGNMLLSMDIVDNKIVAGSKDRRLHMWQMPEKVHTLLTART